MRLASMLYALARALNDADAVRRGPRATGRRVVRKAAWRLAACIVGRAVR